MLTYVSISRGGEPPVRTLGSPQTELQQLDVLAGGDTEPWVGVVVMEVAVVMESVIMENVVKADLCYDFGKQRRREVQHITLSLSFIL